MLGELSEFGGSFVSDAAPKLWRRLRTACAFATTAGAMEDAGGLLVRKDDDIEAAVEISLANTGVDETRVGDAVLIEDPTSPSLSHRSRPPLIHADAGQVAS